MKSVLSSLALFMSCADALYFYIHSHSQKCFFEELPKDTLVVGKFKTTVYNHNTRQFEHDEALSIGITVDETFDNDHRVVNQRGRPDGKFTFTAAEAGDHRLCFTPYNLHPSDGVSHNGMHVGGIKFELDMVIGETSQIESTDKDKLTEVASKVKDLNARLLDVRREQIFQREREAEFRDQSENVNSRVVRWTFIQIVVLALTCTWQLTYLRAFFIKQKLT